MERDSVLGRVGTFFILIGALMISLFVLSDLAAQAEIDFLLFGVGGVLLGFILRWASPRPERQPSGRFRILRARKEKKPRRGLFGSRKVEESDGAARDHNQD